MTLVPRRHRARVFGAVGTDASTQTKSSSRSRRWVERSCVRARRTGPERSSVAHRDDAERPEGRDGVRISRRGRGRRGARGRRRRVVRRRGPALALRPAGRRAAREMARARRPVAGAHLSQRPSRGAAPPERRGPRPRRRREAHRWVSAVAASGSSPAPAPAIPGGDATPGPRDRRTRGPEGTSTREFRARCRCPGRAPSAPASRSSRSSRGRRTLWRRGAHSSGPARATRGRRRGPGGRRRRGAGGAAPWPWRTPSRWASCRSCTPGGRRRARRAPPRGPRVRAPSAPRRCRGRGRTAAPGTPGGACVEKR